MGEHDIGFLRLAVKQQTVNRRDFVARNRRMERRTLAGGVFGAQLFEFGGCRQTADKFKDRSAPHLLFVDVFMLHGSPEQQTIGVFDVGSRARPHGVQETRQTLPQGRKIGFRNLAKQRPLLGAETGDLRLLRPNELERLVGPGLLGAEIGAKPDRRSEIPPFAMLVSTHPR